jgi:hypothetical protein
MTESDPEIMNAHIEWIGDGDASKSVDAGLHGHT